MKLEIVRIAQFTMDSEELETIGAAVGVALQDREYNSGNSFSPDMVATLKTFQALGEQAFQQLQER